MKKISAIEIRRKIMHMSFGVIISYLIINGLITVFDLFIVLALGILLSFAMVKWQIPVLSKLLDLVERKHVHPGKGAITYIVGCILTLKLFPVDIALASIMVLAFGDGISTVIGIIFGKTKTFLSDIKLLEGTVVGILLGGLTATYFVSYFEAFTAATLAMTLEATEIKLNNKILSDNILVPLVAGTTIMIMRQYLG